MKEGTVTCEFKLKGDSSHKDKDIKDEIVTVDNVIHNNNGYVTVLLKTEDKTMISFDVYINRNDGIFQSIAPSVSRLPIRKPFLFLTDVFSGIFHPLQAFFPPEYLERLPLPCKITVRFLYV